MKFDKYLIEQMKKHPSIQPQDIVKLCYQAAYGAEHLLSDINLARKYFDEEYEATEPEETDLYENISVDVCRVNLAAWKAKNLPSEWLFRMVVASLSKPNDREELFLKYLEVAENLLQKQQLSFLFTDWCDYLAEYKKIGMPTVHHSEEYRKCEKPSYRIVNSRYIRLLPILEKVSKWNEKDKTCVIAIDGRAASGKSTMAEQLKNILLGDIIHMDDFFLPLELRTQERLETPGGNIHYERFIEEVLPYVSHLKSFSYRRFDCDKMDYCDEYTVKNTPFRIVEGSYSCHPIFGKYADISVFSDVESDEQMKRIYCRDGSDMAEKYRNKWIPLEEKYFKEYQIYNNVVVRL